MQNFEEIVNNIAEGLESIQRSDNDEELSQTHPYVDRYLTKQQKKRDKKITRLLEQYVDGYEFKVKSNKFFKITIVTFCMAILAAFSCVFIYLMIKLNLNTAADKGITENGLIQLVSVCITFLTLIVGILKIVTSYVFPKGEDEYITRIVEAIQKNDLENKRENIKTKDEKKEED